MAKLRCRLHGARVHILEGDLVVHRKNGEHCEFPLRFTKDEILTKEDWIKFQRSQLDPIVLRFGQHGNNIIRMGPMTTKALGEAHARVSVLLQGL